MTNKTFSVAGTSTFNGVTKVRFANDFVGRLKILFKNGHDNVELIELGGDFTKAQVCEILLNHDKYQGEDQQSAINEFVVRNIKLDTAPSAPTAPAVETTADPVIEVELETA